MMSLFLLQGEQFGDEYLVYSHILGTSTGWQSTIYTPANIRVSVNHPTPQGFIDSILRSRPDWSERFHHLATVDKFDDFKLLHPELFI